MVFFQIFETMTLLTLKFSPTFGVNLVSSNDAVLQIRVFHCWTFCFAENHAVDNECLHTFRQKITSKFETMFKTICLQETDQFPKAVINKSVQCDNLLIY